VKRVGPYLLDSVLGDGGMATLYRGHDERLPRRDVAVKVLKRALFEDPIHVRRFQREASTLANLEHPGIVKVLDFGQDGEDLYIVLELLKGETLGQILAREGRLGAEPAHAIVDRILDALATCHAADVVHRDVKPSNVIVLEGDIVRLIDFGLAKVGGDVAAKLTETGTVHGTPHYMSPEQCRGEDVGPASDIYSVGVLSYEMLAGKTPFAGADAATIMAAHLFVTPPPLPDVAPGIAAVVQSALAKRPEDRPPANELRAAFADAMRGSDAVTRGSANANTRVAELAKPREERALASGPAAQAHDAQGTAWLCMPDGPRAASLLSCLGTAGIDVKRIDGDDAPAGVVIVADLDRLRRVRARDRKRAVIVVDVGGPEDTTEVIRLGADDMLLRNAPDADLVAKVKRLLRRKAR
jgi:eukaryotic-like serine/threonine-protein kinase